MKITKAIKYLGILFLSILFIGCGSKKTYKYELAFVSDRGGNEDIFLINLDEEGNPDSTSIRNVTNSENNEYGIDWSPDGKKLIYNSKVNNNYDVYTIDRDGKNVTRLTSDSAYDGGGSYSPDGKKIIFTSERAFEKQDFKKREFFTMNIDGSDLTRLTFNDEYDCCTHYSPDGNKIVFARLLNIKDKGGEDGNLEIFMMDSDGKNEIQLTNKPKHDALPFWSPDGKKIAFHGQIDSTTTQIFIMNADGSNLKQITNDKFDNRWPTWSPDGKWIAYTSARGSDTDTDIYITNPEGTITKRITFHPKRDEIAIWNPVY